MRFSSASRNPSTRSPSFERTHSSLVLSQVEDQHASAGRGDARRLGDGARRFAGVVQRLRQHRHVDARRRRSAASRARRASRRRSRRGGGRPAPRARSSTTSERSTAMTATPSAPPQSSGSPSPQPRSATLSGGSSMPSARDHAAQLRPGHQLTRVARVGAAVGVEVFLPQPQHFLQPRIVGAHDGSSAARRTAHRASPGASVVASSSSAGRQAVVAVAGVLLFERRGRRP